MMNEQALVADTDDQVASVDEYDIALNEGVEDESLLYEGDTKKFSITSYGADYTVDSLVKRMKGKAFRVPDFQRRYVWSQKHASKFIESLLMGLPVPGIFLYKEAGTNTHLVIDGQQRLRTLESFYSGTFGERKSRLVGIREPWLGRTYDELDPADQLKLDDSIVHATIFTQDEPTDVLDSIYFVFERINSGGIRLSAQEIRNCVSDGPFIKMVHELNHNDDWRRLFGPENKRAKDEELIVRFFAMLENWNGYSRPMDSFLNQFSDAMNRASGEKFEELAQLFSKTVELVNEALNGRAFRPVRSLNAAVFDAVMVGIATRLRRDEANSPAPEQIADAYYNLLQQPEFNRAWERATADEENVRIRMNAAIDAFANL